MLSNGLFLCHVPLFLFFSAYLLALKQEKYTVMLKKKARTLVLPYILWLSFYLFVYKILHWFPQTRFLATGWYNPPKWDITTFTQIYLGYNNSFNLPALAGQFWFLRDLILLTIVAYILTFLLNLQRLRCIPPLVLGLTLLLFLLRKDFIHIGFFPVINFYPIFFFTLGIFCGVNRIDFFLVADKYKYWYLLPSLVFFVCLTKANDEKFFFALPVSQIISCLIWLKISKLILKNERLSSVCQQLAPFSFFLFVAHIPLILRICQFILQEIPFSGGWYLLQYVLLSGMVIGITLLSAIIVKKTAPKFYSFICGGR